MATTNKLTAEKVKASKPKAATQRLADGQGLLLEITPEGSKRWRLRYRFGGAERMLSMGLYPETSLATARDRRDAARKLLAAGVDPSAARKAEKSARAGAAANSFEAVAREWHATKIGGWSPDHAARTLRRMETDVFPYVGSEPIDAVTPKRVLEVVRRVEARGAIETAHTILQQMGQVFDHAIHTDRCETNPARGRSKALRPVIVKHMAAVTDPKAAGALMRSMLDYQGHPVTRAAMVLSALVFQRPGNVRAAEWSEIDLDGAMWTVPSAKIKRTVQAKLSGRPHLIPLSTQAVELLRDLHKLTGHGRYLFPSMLTGERCMSENTINSALRRMGYSKDDMTAHGFRAMARTLLVERLSVHPDVIEAQLAHNKSGPLGAAYDRAEFMEQRRQMMQAWADYLDKLRDGAEVIPFRAA